MSEIRRINPRRPWQRTANGMKRIVLGAQGEGGSARFAGLDAHTALRKPLRSTQPSIDSLWVIVHSERGFLDHHAKQVIAAAAILANAQTAVHLLVFGACNEDIAALGVDVLWQAPAEILPHYAPDIELALVRDLLAEQQPRHVFMADNGLASADLGRRLALALCWSIATQVVEIKTDSVAVYQQQGRVLARSAWPRVILLAPDVVDVRLPFVGRGERASGLPVHFKQTSTSYHDAGESKLPTTELALEEADFIISAGNGVQDLESFHALAEALGAAVGASRVAVDDGRFRRDQQIGATGKTVSASVYLALGISGAVQHLQGIKDCQHVLAINVDASAPIIKRADFSVIDDAEAVSKALLSQVQQAKTQKGAQV